MRRYQSSRDKAIFSSLREHSAHLVNAADLTAQLLGLVEAEQVAGLDRVAIEEASADACRHRLVGMLASTFVTPLDRDHLYTASLLIDDAVNQLMNVANWLTLCPAKARPEQTPGILLALHRGCELIQEAMSRMPAVRDMADLWVGINRQENEVLQRCWEARRIIFGSVDQQPGAIASGTSADLNSTQPTSLMAVISLVDALSTAGEALERVGHHLEFIAVQES